jgi:hypothetical protein
MLNVYRGTVTTDQEGAATVELPGYVAALNREFSYHLTVVGDFARAVVSAPLRDGRLSLRTDQPGVTVCWLVLGVRADPWAEANPIEVERDKPDDERNLFLHPELYDQPPARGLLHSKYRPCANRPDPRPSGRRDAGQRACASSSFLRGAVGGRAVVGWVQALALAVADFAGGIGFGGRAVSAQGGVDGAKPG